MGDVNFYKYLNKFESEVVREGIIKGVIGKPLQVNVRDGKFACTKFARHMGNVIEFSEPFVLDYYGHLKRSRGFYDLIDSKKESISQRQIKSISAQVVFFAALKIEDISAITDNPYLRSKFSDFKKEVLHWRGFEKRAEKVMEEHDIGGKDSRH